MTFITKATTIFSLLLLATACIAQQQTEPKPKFPSTDEIRLVVSQSERVFEQYKQ
jgi:hypothetical protein